jgi:hypothetical protein
VLKDRKFRARSLLEAYLAELAVMQMAEHPSDAVVVERLREYLFNRLTEAIRVLPEDSSRLAEVLIEMLEIATGKAEIVGWRRPALVANEGEPVAPERPTKRALERVLRASFGFR